MLITRFSPPLRPALELSFSALELPSETNPADWILDMTTANNKLWDGRTLAEAYSLRKEEPLSVSDW